MTTDFPNDEDQNDGAWFLEAVGATPPPPSGTDAMAELTKENEIVAADGTPPSQDEPQGPSEKKGEDAEESGPDDEAMADPVTASADDSAPDQPAEPLVDDDSVSANDASTGNDETEPRGDTELSTTTLSTTTIRKTRITVSSFDGNPGTANATYDKLVPIPLPPTPSSPLPVAAGALASATADGAAPPDVTLPQPVAAQDAAGNDVPDMDSELSRPLQSARAFRWPIVVVLLLLVAAVGAAAIWLPRATETEALVVRQGYYDTTSAVRNHLPASQGALDAITGADSSSEELSASIPVIATLDNLASDMQRRAAEPLPSVLPLVPKGPIGALEPLQERTSLLGSDGAEIARRLGNGYIYRIEIPGLMDLENLPTSATTETINTISITLATSLSADAGTVSRLPDDPAFDAVRSQAIASHERYTQWQTEYLNALASEATPAALMLVDELEEMRTSLNAANAAALALLRTQLDEWIVTYATQLETHMASISQS